MGTPPAPFTISPDALPPGIRFAVAVARYNDNVTGRLLEGAIATFGEYGIGEDRLTVAHVPGAFELPVAGYRLAQSGQYAAVLCLGAVIQGDTDHDKYINDAVAHGIMRASLDTGVPVLFGVLTCRTMQQALDRAGGQAGNKGSEAALAAIEMASLLNTLGRAGETPARAKG